MSCSSPKRFPRSLAETPAYDPQWRYLQVEEYLRFRRHLDDQVGTFILPASERDSLVRHYFKFRTGVPTPKHAALRYAHECDETNERTSMGSRIKAMTVAGLTPTEIAGRLHTCVENIETFLKLYFEVSVYVADHAALGAILLPRLEQTSMDTRERVWCLAALKLGVKGLDYILDQKVRLTVEEQREISDAIHNILAEQSLRYSFSLQTKAEAGPEVMEAYQKSQEMRARNPESGDDNKMDLFRKTLLDFGVTRFAPELAAAEAARSPRVISADK